MNEHPPLFIFARHVVSWLVATLFGLSAAMKFFGMPIQVQRFQEWGYPTWFMFLIGFLEVAAAGLLIFLPSRLLGAGVGLVVLIGAGCTHILHAQWRDMMGTGVTMAVLIGVVWLHWNEN